MSELVDAAQIEQIVGAKRHAAQHLARAVSDEETVYILHSQECLDSGIDLTCCTYSVMLDNRGIDPDDWQDYEDKPVVVTLASGRLIPLIPEWLGK